eukprot:gnl/MRDRNA2_/MRDRNA2_124214_c0_seq1.p1 gnl/MRDRNA2_/MRDRNA2_124214_c0~~gnl/MRDRNA2_/MRDRNA2_124214_c0_seq1.p1  ORF type:complete len:245 (+),score=24.67 gnl/MRDRNA2_/MRDRNA2_124214_c0_seq1:103-735(+)
MDDMYNCFLIQKVPNNWSNVSYPCLKPLNSWFSDFTARILFMTNWLMIGPPVSFWLSSFFFPQGFMTASMQVYARTTKIPIDTLAFFTDVTEVSDDASAAVQEKGVNIHGLFIQGAGWDIDGFKLEESEKSVLFVSMPVIWLNPVLQTELGQLAKGCYTSPLYKTSERRGTLSTTGHSTNFITHVSLGSDMDDNNHWVRRGVALLCMLDY